MGPSPAELYSANGLPCQRSSRALDQSALSPRIKDTTEPGAQQPSIRTFEKVEREIGQDPP